jgi:hypothetical protein
MENKMTKTSHKIIRDSLRGKIVQCPCKKDPLTFLLLGNLYNKGLDAVNLNEGEYSYCYLEFGDLFCGREEDIIFREINRRDLSPDQAQVLAKYEQRIVNITDKYGLTTVKPFNKDFYNSPRLKKK